MCLKLGIKDVDSFLVKCIQLYSGPPRPHARWAHLLWQDQMLRGAQVYHGNPCRSDVTGRQQLSCCRSSCLLPRIEAAGAHLLPQF